MANGIIISSEGKRVLTSEGKLKIAGDSGDPCCCGCPAFRPAGWTPTNLVIENYTDDLFGACEDCDTPPDTYPAWDGTFFPDGGGTQSQWHCSEDEEPELTIAGGIWLAGYNQTFVDFVAGGAEGCWRVYIGCLSSSGQNFDIWEGRHTGPTPVGEYTRQTGCSAGPATISIAAA